MTGPDRPRVYSIPFGVSFLPRLARALLDGELVDGFRHDGDPLGLASVTIYVPTRRATRELRSVFVELLGGGTAILPDIRPLGDVDEDATLFEDAASLDDQVLAIDPMERLLLLAPLVRAWKSRLPAHVANMFKEPLVVPVTAADAFWLARDVAALIDEVELEGADWSGLPGLVDRDLAGWWQVTLDFLRIVTEHWPHHLSENQQCNPAAHRNARIDAEARRLAANSSPGPVIAAGSTGSVPATARLLSTIARLPEGAVVLPGLDRHLDEGSWQAIGATDTDPAVFGHPQYGLKKLTGVIGITRDGVVELERRDEPLAARRAARGFLVSEALRPAATTNRWVDMHDQVRQALEDGALEDVALVEASSERDEALAIAIALRRALRDGDTTTALVTGDRTLARRVSAELERYGITANDSAGIPLSMANPGSLLVQLVDTALRPGDPVAVLSLLKHPLLRLGMDRLSLDQAVCDVELLALRGGTGRPDIAALDGLLEARLEEFAASTRKPLWFDRLGEKRFEQAHALVTGLTGTIAPLAALRTAGPQTVSVLAAATVLAFEAAGSAEGGDLAGLYDGEEGEAAANFLRRLISTPGGPPVEPAEWPEVLTALMAGEMVKPPAGADPRVAIWGALEARLQTVDTMVLGGLNEGSWPARTDADRFMSRFMKVGLGLEPPERRIGLAAHDFVMALGSPKVVLTRALRSGEEPAVPSRWLQRLQTMIGENATKAMRERGDRLLGYKKHLDSATDIPFAPRPDPKPDLGRRPRRFSVTEIETLRRDPYAIYAKRILRLAPLDPLMADPGPAERGSLFHDILHQLVATGLDPDDTNADDNLDSLARDLFGQAGLPPDIMAVWWPRFHSMAGNLLEFERVQRMRATMIKTEIAAVPHEIGTTGVLLSGRADRISVLRDGSAEIIDFKTGSTPTRKQAHTLLAPQLPLEGALLARGAFVETGRRPVHDLIYVRLRPDGGVKLETILKIGSESVSGTDLSELSWSRLVELITAYGNQDTGYKSRALPFREGDVDGDYDHLARVLEWSAGGGNDGDGE